MHPPFFSLIIACHFIEVLNCMSNRLRLHAILSISLTKPHLVQLINITPESISSCEYIIVNKPIHMCTPLLKSLATGLYTCTCRLYTEVQVSMLFTQPRPEGPSLCKPHRDQTEVYNGLVLYGPDNASSLYIVLLTS